MPWEYSFSHSKYPLYLSITFLKENSDYLITKSHFLSKTSIKDKKSASAIFWETCRGHVLSQITLSLS
jgi:hypothetical protein